MQPEHELQNKEEVLALLLRHTQGMPLGQIKDAYKGVEDDVKVHSHAAAVLQQLCVPGNLPLVKALSNQPW